MLQICSNANGPGQAVRLHVQCVKEADIANIVENLGIMQEMEGWLAGPFMDSGIGKIEFEPSWCPYTNVRTAMVPQMPARDPATCSKLPVSMGLPCRQANVSQGVEVHGWHDVGNPVVSDIDFEIHGSLRAAPEERKLQGCLR